MLEVAHPDQANVSKKALRESIAKKMKTDEKNVVVYGMKTHFGGGRSTGFALIYENQQYLLKYEPKFRLRRSGVIPKKNNVRKSNKEAKGKIKR